jgi:hypothetical protein
MTQQITLTLTPQQIAVIGEGLGYVPYIRAAAVVAEINRQLAEQQSATVEAAAG